MNAYNSQGKTWWSIMIDSGHSELLARQQLPIPHPGPWQAAVLMFLEYVAVGSQGGQ